MAMDGEEKSPSNDQECQDCGADCGDCPFEGIVSYDRKKIAAKVVKLLGPDGLGLDPASI